MAEFTYNNAKNVSTSHISLEFNHGYHLWILFENDANSYSKSCSAEELVKKVKDLMSICQQNLLHAQELQKRAYDKKVKSRSSYASGKKI